MSIRIGDGKNYIGFVEGVDDTSPSNAPYTDNTLSVALNTDLTDDAMARNRNGYAPVNTTAWATRNIRYGFEYRKSTGVFENLLYGEDSPVTGTSGVLGRMNGVAIPSNIKTGLADNLKPSIIQFRTLAFVFNGTDDFLYDGTATRQIGITPPTTAATFNVLINGALNELSPYLYTYTYYNSVTGAESSAVAPSAIMTTGTTAANQDGIRINITPGTATTADLIRIYRTVAGGSVFFLEGTTAITSTTYDSVAADSALGIQLEPDNSRLPGFVKYAIVLDNRVFVAGFSANPNRIQFSKIGQEGAKPESFQAADFVDCNLNDGDKIIGLGIANNAVLVLKERSVGKLTPIQINSGGVELAGSRKYIYEQLSGEVTGVSHHTLTSVDIFAVWLGKDDIYGTDGAQIYRFGRRILKTYRNLNFTYAYKWSVVNKITKQQIIFSVTRRDESEPDFQLVGHYRNFPKVAWTYYSPNLSDTTNFPGLTAASLFQATENGLRVYYFGSSRADGTVYKFDFGGNDNGKGIYWDVRLPWDNNNNPSKMKMFHSYFVTLITNTEHVPITHSFEIEKQENIVVSETAFLNSRFIKWVGFNWAQANWPGGASIPLGFFPHRKAHFGRYGFQNSGIDQSIQLIALVRNVINMTIDR